MERNGIYVHIPYCLQQCPYCDFATVLNDHALKKEDYVDMVLHEIRNRNHAVPFKKVSTLYFGGGTPSLLKPHLIDAVIQELKAAGFDFSDLEEATLEINPGTIDESSLGEFLAMGITRFSVGIQTFNDSLLKKIGREHSADESIRTLELLKSTGVNYTLDLLFALPDQSLEDLKQDLVILQQVKPPHVSAYVLTVPDKNPLAAMKPSDEIQVEMFYRVEKELAQAGLNRYEVSSYTVAGNHSRHNTLYWEDQNYWGLGMSAHSYFKTGSSWGIRFWNPPHLNAYGSQVLKALPMTSRIEDFLPPSQFENLTQNQSLTDFCHTRLRTTEGLSLLWLQKKFCEKTCSIVTQRLEGLLLRGLISKSSSHYFIKKEALVLSEQVYQEMTFLPSDL